MILTSISLSSWVLAMIVGAPARARPGLMSLPSEAPSCHCSIVGVEQTTCS